VLGLKVNTVALAWADAANNNVSYNIRRATNAAFTTAINNSTATANATSASQTLLATNTTYYYEVQAVNSVGTSAWVTVSVTTKP
jgi:predicted phage tail protein